MSLTHGKIWWSELMTRDVLGAVKYYTEVCGWHIEAMPMPEGDYYVATVHGKQVAGIMDMEPLPHLAEVPPHWFTYIAVDDVDAAVADTKARGGAIIRDSFDVPNVGRIAIMTDPSGAAVGLMTPIDWGAENAASYEADPVDENMPV